MRRLKNAHRPGAPPGALNMSRFNLLSQEFRHQQSNNRVVFFKLHTYVDALAARGGGYVFVDACRVVRGGNTNLPRSTATLYRDELWTMWEPHGRHVNVPRTPALHARAHNEAAASAPYKRNRVSRADLLTTAKGLRPLRAGVSKKKTLAGGKKTPSRKLTESVLRAYSGVSAPPAKARAALLRNAWYEPSRYRV